MGDAQQYISEEQVVEIVSAVRDELLGEIKALREAIEAAKTAAPSVPQESAADRVLKRIRGK
jgi:hypothetical protein